MKNFRKEFPILTQNTYLNTASSGILYNSLLEYRQEHDLDFLIGGSIFREQQQHFLTTVKQSIASFLGAPNSEIVLVSNFSTGFNTILEGINTKQKVLLLDEDYPSINFAVLSKGFEVCYAEVNAVVEENIKTAIQKHKPNVFAFSLVQYISGITIDLEFIKELKRDYPDMLIIADATQFCGTKSFDFESSGIDILGSSSYKWLLGGYGNGFIICKQNILESITPTSYINASTHSPYDSSYTNLQARFECGHLDTLTFGSLQHSIHFLTSIGLSNIEKKINELSTYLKDELKIKDLLGKDIIQRTNHSSIFNIKGDQNLFNFLREQNIITSLRGEGIRISLHFYNTIEDIDALFSALYRYR